MMLNKKVSDKNLIDSLNESIRRTNNSLDFLENEINRNIDLYKYNENDLVAKSNLENLKHIEFCLIYLNDSFGKVLKGLVK